MISKVQLMLDYIHLPLIMRSYLQKEFLMPVFIALLLILMSSPLTQSCKKETSSFEAGTKTAATPAKNAKTTKAKSETVEGESPVEETPVEEPETAVTEPAPAPGPMPKPADPGEVKAIKIGVNFEDQLGAKDIDYNDAVLCFTGNFNFSPQQKSITSMSDQKVSGVTTRKGKCKHNILIVIHRLDGSTTDLPPLASNSGKPVDMNFKTGDRLEVYMQPTSGCNTNIKRDMWNSSFALILPNECRTSGK